MRVIVMVFSMIVGAVLVGLLLMATLFLSGAAHASENVPALLRYAQQYDGGNRGVLSSPANQSHQAVQELQHRQLTARVKALTAQLAEKDKQLAALRDKQQVSGDEAQGLVKMLTTQLADKDALLTAIQEKQQVALTTEAARVRALTTELAEKDKRLDDLAKQLPAPVNLDSAAAREAYATGVLFGRDVQTARDANQQMGLKLDDTLLLAGLTDALTGKPKMEEGALAMAQEDARKAAEKALVSTVATQRKADAAWVGRFAKQKGVVKAPEGYWYRVEHEGDGMRLNANDTVALVVTETLADGTVVSDMEGAGGSLMDTVSALPPAFAGALGALKNHGSLTLVVPPELAYGDKGYPPKVPPGATMVYKLRVADVIAAPDEKKRKP
ncbi:FKBP-type peptidyl-prolyl cis-trans isomerase N-terminal domain-containing protein [Serratia marcescens]|uniref:FKBP-type peptidyl-prolyl cis-trans isomerase N-terminal domain-containing protein n=1 Tax=Serratia marcescens TaxID=615 RepID=UPI0002AF36C5|nr:FKBP-type peptidyl-prolyl cis-trans isomerase N-terminal domain-containing protein [Serratia marcescens]AGE16430.1 FKBP-type peptidyl-prolyl cis-trans isomerase FkpA [Serratia marcescens WW4]